MTPFANILLKVIHLDIQIEIAGWRIYCRGNTYPVKEYLKDLGFWFSGKHKAWVYSGKKKLNVRPKRGQGAYDLYEAVEVNRESTPKMGAA